MRNVNCMHHIQIHGRQVPLIFFIKYLFKEHSQYEKSLWFNTKLELLSRAPLCNDLFNVIKLILLISP